MNITYHELYMLSTIASIALILTGTYLIVDSIKYFKKGSYRKPKKRNKDNKESTEL